MILEYFDIYRASLKLTRIHGDGEVQVAGLGRGASRFLDSAPQMAVAGESPPYRFPKVSNFPIASKREDMKSSMEPPSMTRTRSRLFQQSFPRLFSSSLSVWNFDRIQNDENRPNMHPNGLVRARFTRGSDPGLNSGGDTP
jgi:hypothetical protein